MQYAKTFRLFISSTFSDFRKERQLLHERVFPLVENYIEKHYPTYSFLPIDLRWGVTEEIQYNQKTLELCLNEVNTCKHYLHPNFLIMVGERYGWVPLPYAIEKNEFEMILSYYTRDEKSSNILRDWYKEDTNYVVDNSTAYILKARELNGEYATYDKWEEMEGKIRSLLQIAVKSLFKPYAKSYQKYFMSATEAEVKEGIFHYLEPTKKQDSLKEELSDLPTLDKKYVFGFIREFDKKSKENVYDKNLIDSNQEDVIQFKKHLYASEIALCTQTVNIHSFRKQTLENEYIKSFIEYIFEKIRLSIDAQVQMQSKNIVDQEKISQVYFVDSRTKIFFGRQDELLKVQNYIDNPISSQPLVIVGKSGVGKSAFMAKVTQSIVERRSYSQGSSLYFSFIGATPFSSNIFSLLSSLIQDLVNNNILQEIDVPQYKGNKNRFYRQVKDVLLAIEKPTIIILDALDQLEEKDFLTWLPEELPEHLKIVVSTLNEKEMHYFDILKNRVDEGNIISLYGVSNDDAKDILIKLLDEYQRDLTPMQKSYVLKKFEENENLPLYIKVAFEEIHTWKSFDEDETLANGIENLICEYIDNLTDKFHHNKYFVHKVLGYIKASKMGLSEKELLDILSKDSALLDSLEKFGHTLTLKIEGKERRKFPVAVWARLYEDLKDFLMSRFIDGQELIKFFHRGFDEVVGRYIYEGNKQKIHQELADYFMELQDRDKSWDERYNNLHMLDELPHHLFYAKDSVRLQSILFDLEFAGSVHDHHKQDGFRQILEQATELDGISDDEIYPWESFYREYDHLIVGHQSLFQFAYEDGLDSPLYIKAQELIANQRVNFRWLKKREIKTQMFRKGIIKAYTDVPMWALSSGCKYCVLADKTIVLSDEESMLINTKNKKIFPWKIVFKYDMEHFFAVDWKTVYKINYLGNVEQQFKLEDEFMVASYKGQYTFIVTQKLIWSEYTSDYELDQLEYDERHRQNLLILDENFIQIKDISIIKENKYLEDNIEELYILSNGIILYTSLEQRINSYSDDCYKNQALYYLDFKTEKIISLFEPFGGFCGDLLTKYQFISEQNNKITFKKSEPYQYGSNSLHIKYKEFYYSLDLNSLLVLKEEIIGKPIVEIYPICIPKTISSLDNKIYLNKNEYVYVDDKVYFIDHTKEYNNKILIDERNRIDYKILANKNILICYQDKIYLFNYKKLIYLGFGKMPEVESRRFLYEGVFYDFDGNILLSEENIVDMIYTKETNNLFKPYIISIFDENLSHPMGIGKLKMINGEEIIFINASLKDNTKVFHSDIFINEKIIIDNYQFKYFSDFDIKLIAFWIAYDEFVLYNISHIENQKVLYIEDALNHYKCDFLTTWIDVKKYPNVVKDFVENNSLYFVSDGTLFYIENEPYGLLIQTDKFHILDLENGDLVSKI